MLISYCSLKRHSHRTFPQLSSTKKEALPARFSIDLLYKTDLAKTVFRFERCSTPWFVPRTFLDPATTYYVAVLHVLWARARAVCLKSVYGSTNRTSSRSTVLRLNDAVVANTSRTAAAGFTPIILFANRQNFSIEMFGGNVAHLLSRSPR